MKSWLKAKSYSAAKILINAARLDTLALHYDLSGILAYQNTETSGEAFFVRGPLMKVMPKSGQVMFDVGANSGEYTALLRHYYTDARIIAIEPNPIAFAAMVARFDGDSKISCKNLGLSSEAGFLNLFDYGEQSGSGHASFYPAVFSDLHEVSRSVSLRVPVDRLDVFCDREAIERIDFLKIDTEGHELSVLRGAEGLLKTGRLNIIQFEFNEMNVISRVFLRDFYILLDGYSLFRLYKNKLIDLGHYNSKNELFKFQNIVAAREPTSSFWREKYC